MPEQKEIHTRFKRSRLCRVIHVDGAYGSVTAQLNIHAALFSEHRAFPEGTVIRQGEGGQAVETPLEDPGIVIREIECDLILSYESAVALRDWLSVRVDELGKFRENIVAGQ